MKKIDLQDVFLVVGVISIVAGVNMLSHAAAAIVFGLFCLAGVRMIAIARPVKADKPEGKS